MNIPNLITAARLVLAPAVVWLTLEGQLQAAFVFFVLAGVSDALDGYLAKRFSWETRLGALLDPLADKMLLMGLFLALGIRGSLPLWLAAAAAARDLLIMAGVAAAWCLGRPMAIRPLPVGKANTLMQLVLVAVTLGSEGFNLGLSLVQRGLIWGAALLLVVSFTAYAALWVRHMRAPHNCP